ncbi:hypothetical protein [Lacihabitans soyangensis]|nr:hypothetical protein [Lacihabitans soyangensis]
MNLFLFSTANGQTSIPYSRSSITIDSAKAERIQTDLLQLRVYKEIARFQDSIIVETKTLYLSERNKNATTTKRNETLEREKKVLKRRLVLQTLEIWAYRVGIVAGTYFILKN